MNQYDYDAPQNLLPHHRHHSLPSSRILGDASWGCVTRAARPSTPSTEFLASFSTHQAPPNRHSPTSISGTRTASASTTQIHIMSAATGIGASGSPFQGMQTQVVSNTKPTPQVESELNFLEIEAQRLGKLVTMLEERIASILGPHGPATPNSQPSPEEVICLHAEYIRNRRKSVEGAADYLSSILSRIEL